LVAKIRATYPKLKITGTADGLFSNQPFIDELKAASLSFILVAKSADHKLLFEWVNQVPLNGTKDADLVNFFQYQLVAKTGKVTYNKSWVTDSSLF
jgi:hypothetical protein